MQKRRCQGCNVDISHKHPNAKFHSKKCKDKHWNRVNPRGMYAHLKDSDSGNDYDYDDNDPSWDAHKDSF